MNLQDFAFPHLFSVDPYFPVCSSMSLQANGPLVLPADDYDHHDAYDYEEDDNDNDGGPAAMSCSLERGFLM